MKNHLATLLFAAGLAAVADANAAFDQAVCYKGCTESTSNVALLKHEANMKKIREKKTAELDPEKIKDLQAQDELEVERYKGELVKSCRKMCLFDKPELLRSRD